MSGRIGQDTLEGFAAVHPVDGDLPVGEAELLRLRAALADQPIARRIAAADRLARR